MAPYLYHFSPCLSVVGCLSLSAVELHLLTCLDSWALLAADDLLGGGELEHAELVLLHLEWSASGAVGAEELDRAVLARLGNVIVECGGVGALDELGTLNVHDGVVVSIDGTALTTVLDVQPHIEHRDQHSVNRRLGPAALSCHLPGRWRCC